MNGPPGAGTAARVLALAARALAAVIGRGVSAEEALAGVAAPGPLRAPVQAVLLGTLRWYLRLAPALARLYQDRAAPGDARLRSLLACAVHQLEYSTHPAPATVAAAVDAARLAGLAQLARLVNGVLRRWLRERSALLAAVDADAATRQAYPRWLADALARAWPDEGERLLEAGNRHPEMCLRVDLARASLADMVGRLAAAGIGAEPVEAVPTALRLAAPVPVAQLPGFAEGLVSVQDAAAQLAAQLLGPRAGERILDACAAPGGKTGALLELAGGAIELVAVDHSAQRLVRVRENLARLGREAQVLQADLLAGSGWWQGPPFDAILLDAPCSGTGVIRRHPDIKLLRRASDIAGFALTQRALLEALWPQLKPGGRLLYVTCSVLPEENSAVVAGFLAAHPDARELDLPAAERLSPPLKRCQPGWQLLPGAWGDGFYYACLGRAGHTAAGPHGE
jgi:16S rRNA (cytosine967-C5)-methyltransferase